MLDQRPSRVPVCLTLSGHPVHLLLRQFRQLLRLRSRSLVRDTIIPPVGALAPATILCPVNGRLGRIDIHGIAAGRL